jgi:hypothetical protein
MDQKEQLALQLYMVYKKNENKIKRKKINDILKLKMLHENDLKYEFLRNRIK